PIIGVERTEKINQKLIEARRRPLSQEATEKVARKMPPVEVTPSEKPFKAKPKIGAKPEAATRVFSNYEKKASEYIGKEPENIQKLMNSRSGIKKLKGDLAKKEGGTKLFEDLKLSKFRELVPNDEYTGLEFYKTLNKNTEILSELFGKDLVDQAKREAFKEGKQILKRENIVKRAKLIGVGLASGSGLLKLFDLLSSNNKTNE